VPQGICQSFERLRALHSHGIFCYEAFTAAEDLSRLVFEHALAERFMTFHVDGVPLRAKDGRRVVLPASRFADVYAALHRGGKYTNNWKLEFRAGPPMAFKGTLTDLWRWARLEGLLHGQRNRLVERAFIEIRNKVVAHPYSHHLSGPIESARAIKDVAEIINRLWDVLTPGGRLYPTPIEREVLVIASAPTDLGPKTATLRAEQLPDFNESGDWQCIVVRAVRTDAYLPWFDPRFETQFPSEQLWGPANIATTMAWLSEATPTRDFVEYLDRLFVLQSDGTNLERPRRPEVAAALPAEERVGEWYLVKADNPGWATVHVGHVMHGEEGCAELGECKSCAAEIVAHGSWADVERQLDVGRS
jgi:hypothetical protein